MQARGFTLIELLVVIAIIGILAGVVLASLSGARVASRDIKRIAEIKSIANALELYRIANGSYPPISCDSRFACWLDGTTGLKSYLVPTYIAQLPVDPTNNLGDGYMCGNCGEYSYMSDGTKFQLSTYLATNAAQKTGVQWDNYFEVPAVIAPPFTHSGSYLYGPFFSIGMGCKPLSFFTCN